MQEVHRTLAIVLLVMACAFTVGALIAARLRGAGAWLEWFRRSLMSVIALQTVVGVLLYGSGRRPFESLHLIYGAAALLAVPFGSYFAAEAPARPRAAVLAGAGLLTVGILFRAFVTG